MEKPKQPRYLGDLSQQANILKILADELFDFASGSKCPEAVDYVKTNEILDLVGELAEKAMLYAAESEARLKRSMAKSDAQYRKAFPG